jgi:hypothetical protein
MKRLWVNRRFLNKRSWQIAGSVYAVIGLAGMLANLDELIFPSLAIGIRVIIGTVDCHFIDMLHLLHKER